MKGLTKILLILFFSALCAPLVAQSRQRISFNSDWKFSLGQDSAAIHLSFNDKSWRTLTLPHDWSIEGPFSENNPSGVGGGALPGGMGWYRKKFELTKEDAAKKIFIDFDGVYCNSEVWINGHLLGKRPNGYISFRYELTPYLKFKGENIITVKVDNSRQPNSRWYSGSGIYRNVWLTKTNAIYIDQWGTQVMTPEVKDDRAIVVVITNIHNAQSATATVQIRHTLLDEEGKTVSVQNQSLDASAKSTQQSGQKIILSNPKRWSVDSPYLYTLRSEILREGKVIDAYETKVGIRSFDFDPVTGFSLNGKPMKILGVCNHHDLGALGTAVNVRALERQLEIMKAMGVNGIRTSHNPPAPELLDLCDRMGFIVMDEMFDMWKKRKTEYDYSQYWDEWHDRDLRDFIRRDRNHPSVMIWSIGNEIPEQWDSTGSSIATELVRIVKELDPSRPITTGNNETNSYNNIIKSGALDLIGYNYHHQEYASFHERYPGRKFIATETTSALATRGHYDMPSDSIRRWPIAWDKVFTEGNKDNTVSAYDNVSAPWGSTHEETWKVMKKHPHLSGMFIWTGFDYIGEPTPYGWPSRSSYFGIVDLAGFPKDAYYLYQSEWTTTPVLHVFPHWNWQENQIVDVWAYYNNADEVELFLNGVSQGIRKKQGDDLHVMWRMAFQAGELKAISRKNGKVVLTKIIKTAGAAHTIVLRPDRQRLTADGKDLCFVTVEIRDKDGNLVPSADNTIKFSVDGGAAIAAIDNGDPTSHESFQGNSRRAFNGLALVVIKADKPGKVIVTASSDGLQTGSTTLQFK